MHAQLSPAVQLIPPSSATSEVWLADDLVSRRRYRLGAAAAAALAAAAEPQPVAELVRRLASADPATRTAEEWTSVVAALRARKLLVDGVEDDARLAWVERLRREWSRFGWHEAAQYHALTFDYPCIDYAEGAAMRTDRDRMRRYQASEADDDRVKTAFLDRPETPLPDPAAPLAPAAARDVWDTGVEPAPLTADALAAVVGLTFGLTGSAIPVTAAAPILLRSSPSGGARHPSEGYVVARTVPGLARGWYHVTIRPFGLRLLDAPAEEDVLRAAFPETLGRCPFDPAAIVVITSLFERNMYRYREPRTFRTVHMDAGHLAATACLAARALGLRWAFFPSDDGVAIEGVLGLDGLREGYMTTVALGDGGDPLPVGHGR